MQRSETGCLPCTNSCITVPQDKFIAAEYFGSFYNLYGPGLACVGFDCLGMCISLRSITSRVEQLIVRVPTKTQDNVFVEVEVAIQFSVNPENAKDAFYKLADVGAQIDSYVSDVVRSQIPTMTLDQAFHEKDATSTTVQEELAKQMSVYGFQVHKALVTEIAVSSEVMQSMNEINKQKRLRDASVMAAEAEKIRVVKNAEAEADATALSGQGIARQRGAIIQGLKDAITTSGRELTQDDVVELMLTTQYFETLRDIGSHKNCKAYFLPDEPEDVDSQVRQGMLEGQTALEFLSGARNWAPQQQRRPQQQLMAPPPARQQTRLGAGDNGLLSLMDEEPNTSLGAPSQPQRQSFTPGRSSPPAPSPSPPPAYQQPPAPAPRPAQTARQLVTLQVQVPPGVGPGQQLQVQAPDGRMVLIPVPPGVTPGTVLQVQV